VSGTGSRPAKAQEASTFLSGRKLADEDVLREAAEMVAHVARPLQNTDFSMSWRKQAAREFAARALRALMR
jgi:CO/xanthine dehydrogenase FAD-binding subunit